ncbi:hypothetical protein Droror1_Dr00020570 [Drosera rotundifolia]
MEKSVWSKMAELRLACDREIKTQTERVDADVKSFLGGLVSVKAASQRATESQGLVVSRSEPVDSDKWWCSTTAGDGWELHEEEDQSVVFMDELRWASSSHTNHGDIGATEAAAHRGILDHEVAQDVLDTEASPHSTFTQTIAKKKTPEVTRAYIDSGIVQDSATFRLWFVACRLRELRLWLLPSDGGEVRCGATEGIACGDLVFCSSLDANGFVRLSVFLKLDRSGWEFDSLVGCGLIVLLGICWN